MLRTSDLSVMGDFKPKKDALVKPNLPITNMIGLILTSCIGFGWNQRSWNQCKAASSQLKSSVGFTTSLVIPKIEIDNRIDLDKKGWQIREALMYSYHWGYASVVAEDFVRLKRDCQIIGIINCSDTGFYVKQAKAKMYLG